MKKLINVLFLFESLAIVSLPLVACKQTVRSSNNSANSSNPSNTYESSLEDLKFTLGRELDDKYIWLLTLKDRNELINKLEKRIKDSIFGSANIQNKSLKIYDKNNNSEINYGNGDSIIEGFKVKVKLVLERDGSKLPVEFNCKITGQGMSYLENQRCQV